MQQVAIIQDNDKFVVSQSNALIEANYPTSMTARAHKTARLILSLISPDDKDLRTYTVNISSLKQYLGMKANTRWGAFYKELEVIQDRLNKHLVEIKTAEGDAIRAAFLGGMQVSPKRGTVTFEISGLLKPYLLQLKAGYTSYLLANIPKLKSSYSIRLYELLHQYRKIGKRYFLVSDLQKKVGSNYPKYSNFKIKVLKQAQKDLKEHTDLAFAFDERKESRRVVGIEFIIFANTPKQKNENQLSFLDDAIEVGGEQEKPAFSETIVKSMNELGISEQNIAKYLALGFEIVTGDKAKKQAVMNRCKTVENYYLEKLELTKQSTNKENAAGFFIKALKGDWISSKAQKAAKAQEAAKKRKEVKTRLKTLSVQVDNLQAQKEAAKAPIIAKLLEDEAILKAAYNTVSSEMTAYMKNHYSDILDLPIIEQYKKGVGISSGMNMYFMDNFPDKFTVLKDLDAQITEAQKEIKAIKKKYPAIG